jgi:hypothetical protein
MKTRIEYFDADWKSVSNIELDGPPALGQKHPMPAGAVHKSICISMPVSCCEYEWHEVLRV